MSRCLLPVVRFAIAFALLGCSADEPAVARDFALERFEGRWHEIARIPRDYDRRCVGTTADYRSTARAELELTHRCRLGSADGTRSDFRATLRAEDENEPAKLSLDLGLYRGAYWVLEVGKDYEYALIGHPSRTMLWVLARQPTLASSSYDHLLDAARREGFSVDQLERTPQPFAGD